MKEGLSQTSVSCLLKDSRGLMWFGTEDGLNKYDGTTFTVYRHEPGNAASLSSSYINDIVEDKDGYLWVATQKGLNYYNPDTETFKRYFHNLEDEQSISHNEVHALLKANDGRLIIGTWNGLDILSKNNEFLSYRPDRDTQVFYNITDITIDTEGYLWVLSSEFLEKIKLTDSSLKVIYRKHLRNTLKNCLYLDSSYVWIGTDVGLIRFNKQTKEYKTFTFYSSHTYRDKRNNVLSIIDGQPGKLWLSTLEGGLVNFDKVSGQFKTITHTPFNRSGLNSNSIRSLYIDDKNILWAGTFGGGINKHDPDQFEFEHYKLSPNDKISLSENTVRSILHDRDGELWIGTHDGLNRINRVENEVIVYRSDHRDSSTISSNTVRALKEDTKGIIWIGTWSNGLNSFDKKTGKFTRYAGFHKDSNLQKSIRSLEIDKYDNVWIGGNGLWKLNPESKELKQYLNSENSKGYIVTNLFFDKDESLWIGTYQNGIIHLKPSSNVSEMYVHKADDSTSLSHNYITSITQDKEGSLWIGTYGGGLNKFNRITKQFERYNTSNGLLNDVIYGIVVDEHDFIWFSSNAGLTRFDSNTNTFNYFGLDAGIQSEEFNAGAYAKSDQGELFFGGINGFNAFLPETFNKSRSTAKLIFTDFSLLDEKNRLSLNEVSEKHISRTDTMKLNYDQNNFSIRFSELNYANTVDNNYEYQLKGLTSGWQSLGKRKVITLGNLDPGNYILTARIVNDPEKFAKLSIFIAPPFWRTKLAYFTYLLMLITMALIINQHQKKIRLTKQRFEAKIKSLENDINLSSQFNQNNNVNNIPLKEVSTSSVNEKFLKRAVEIIEEHIENSDFDVQDFADEMFMSRSQLYRKLKANTGHSTTKFIRLIRLKRAAQLLSKDTASVSEIAYKVGFENVGYFSKCFNETFGKPPSQYTG